MDNFYFDKIFLATVVSKKTTYLEEKIISLIQDYWKLYSP